LAHAVFAEKGSRSGR